MLDTGVFDGNRYLLTGHALIALNEYSGADTRRKTEQMYRRALEYLPESRTFLLEDGISVGALFQLTPVGTEARTPRFMAELRDAIQTALADAIPERDDSPWILQVYVQDAPSLEAFQKEVADYVHPDAKDSAFSRHFQQTFAAHLARISRPGGLFTDEAVTGTRWRGQIRRVRAVLYRRIKVRGRVPPAVEVEADPETLADLLFPAEDGLLAIVRDIATAEDAVREFRSEGGTIGRSLNNDWILPDPDKFISGKHATIDCKGGIYYIVDISTNGVYANDERKPIGKGKPVPLGVDIPRLRDR